jgi:serine protease Do
VRRFAYGLAFVLVALSGCKYKLGGGGTSSSSSALPSGAVPVPALSLAPPAAAPPPGQLPVPAAAAPATFADLTTRIDPAVVFVRTLQESRNLGGRRQVIGEGLGSAFVFDPNGLILTNNHVIEGASEIRVIFGRKKEMDATVVGRDPPTDVAVLRVSASGLAHVPMGDSEQLRVGDWVIAIGNPFGLSHTVSAGIISAKGRTNQDVKGLDEFGYYDFLQTDASINPGNSGGPLVDMGGHVVGINTAIRAQANNIGFAIPINMIKEIIPTLLKDGKINRSAIGVHVSALMPEDLARLAMTEETGAIVRFVVPGGPADRAGLRPDDVIRAFEGQPILTPDRLRWVASLAGVGRTVTVRVTRGTRNFDLKLTLDALPQHPGPEERRLPPNFPGIP